MVYHIIGNRVKNAATYELLDKIGEEYVVIAASSVNDFDLSAIDLTAGEHVLAVRAKANGYTTSNCSNEVRFMMEGA